MLAAAAVAGDRHALETLIRTHQEWIYNIALRMVWRPEDAHDVTQEILIKVLTRLASFRGESAFRTWLYRIVVNHLTNMRRRRAELAFSSFSSYGRGIDMTPDADPPDPDALPVDAHLVYEDIRIGCMMGMILCLDRTQRLAFILGAMLGADASSAAEIMGISSETFRQKLSRGRRKIRHFMSDKCGLVRPENPCHCARKAGALLASGHVDPARPRFAASDARRIRDMARRHLDRLDDELKARTDELVTDQPFFSADFIPVLKDMISRPAMRGILSFN